MPGDGPVLVLGAGGKTGNQVTVALGARGVVFRAGSRRPEGLPFGVRFDWADDSTWAPALDGVSALYLVKPPVEPIVPVRALLERASGLRQVVLLSEMGREHKPADDPERAVELLVESGPWETTILRPSWFLQNWSAEGAYGEQVRRHGTLVLPSGDAGLSLVDVRDVAEVAALALTAPSGLGGLTLTGSESVTAAELAARIGAAAGRPVRHVSPTLEESARRLREVGASEPMVRYLTDIEADAAAGVCATVHDDLPRMLGRAPRTIDAFVAEHAGYWGSAE